MVNYFDQHQVDYHFLKIHGTIMNTTLGERTRRILLESLPPIIIIPIIEEERYGGPEEGGWYYKERYPIEKGEKVLKRVMPMHEGLLFVERANRLAAQLIKETTVLYEWSTFDNFVLNKEDYNTYN